MFGIGIKSPDSAEDWTMNESAPGAFKKEDSCTHATRVILSGFNTAGVEQRHVVLQLKVSNGKTTWPLLHLKGILEACPIYSIQYIS